MACSKEFGGEWGKTACPSDHPKDPVLVENPKIQKAAQSRSVTLYLFATQTNIFRDTKHYTFLWKEA